MPRGDFNVILLIPLCFLLLFFTLTGRVIGGLRLGFGHAFVVSVVIFYLWVIVTTNLLSFFHILSFWPLLITWLISCGLLLLQIRHIRQHVNELFARLKNIATENPLPFWITFVLFTIFGGGTFLSAILYPVNNGDSLFMHLPRVFFALQFQSIAPYPTSVFQQFAAYPLGSWTITQVVILGGSAYWAVNLVQWMSYLLSTVICLLIARRMHANAWGQTITMAAALTVTGAILQASTTQYDLVFATVLLSAVYFSVCILRAEDSNNKSLMCLLGISLGLSLIAKVTVIPLFLPFFIWVAGTLWKRVGAASALYRMMIVVLLAVTVASPWLIRNVVMFEGDILLSRQAHMVGISDRSPGPLWANLWRAFFMEFSTPAPLLNRTFEQVADIVGSALGTPITSTINTEFEKYQFKLFESAPIHHDYQASPFTWWLILLSLLSVFIMRKPPRMTRSYALCSVSGFLLTGTLITWHPYLARTLTPALIVGAPLIGVVMGEVLTRTSGRAKVARLCFSILLIGSLLLGGLALFYNRTNPLLPDAWLGLPEPHALGWWDTPREELAYRITTPTLEPAINTLRIYLEEHQPQAVLFIGNSLDGNSIDGLSWPLLQLFDSSTVVWQEGTTILPSTKAFVGMRPTAVPDLIILQESKYPDQDIMEYRGASFTRSSTMYVPARVDYGQPEHWFSVWVGESVQ